MGDSLAVSSRNGDKIWVEQELDGSLRLLDVIGTARDGLFQMKEHIKNIQSAIRRSKTQEEVKSRVYAYLSFKKKTKKVILKGFKELKRVEGNSECSPVLETQQNPMVMTGLQEAKFTTLSVFESLLVLMFTPRSINDRRSLFSRWMKRGQVACELHSEEMSDIVRMGASLNSLCSQKSLKNQDTHHVQKQLEDLERRLEELDEDLNCIFRSLIKARVTILNILSN